MIYRDFPWFTYKIWVTYLVVYGLACHSRCTPGRPGRPGGAVRPLARPGRLDAMLAASWQWNLGKCWAPKNADLIMIQYDFIGFLRRMLMIEKWHHGSSWIIQDRYFMGLEMVYALGKGSKNKWRFPSPGNAIFSWTIGCQYQTMSKIGDT